MKKFFALLLACVLSVVLLSGCSQSPEASVSGTPKKISIGIIQPMDHPSLNTIYEAIVEGLNQLGLSDKIQIDYKNAQGDSTALSAIVNQFIGDGKDILVPIGTAPAQAAAGATKTIPIVFAAVSYPVQAGLVTSLDKTDGNITGVSNAIAIEDIFALAKKLTPNAKHFGLLYTSSEINSVSGIQRAKTYCDANGLTYTEATITSTADLQQAAQSLMGKVDAIFTPNDNTIASAMPVLSAEGIKAKTPVYVGADSMVKDGGLATVGIDYTLLGHQVADMIKRIMDGAAIKDTPVEVVKEYAKIVNTTTAGEIGVAISDDLLKEFTIMK